MLENLFLPEAGIIVEYPFTPTAKTLDIELKKRDYKLTEREYERQNTTTDDILTREYEPINTTKIKFVRWVKFLPLDYKPNQYFQPEEILKIKGKQIVEPSSFVQKLKDPNFGFESVNIDYIVEPDYISIIVESDNKTIIEAEITEDLELQKHLAKILNIKPDDYYLESIKNKSSEKIAIEYLKRILQYK